jgi:hypothetical protein
VFPESKGAIKKEPQVAPCGARPERGGPCVGGIAEVDVRVDIAVRQDNQRKGIKERWSRKDGWSRKIINE